jgi:hypothetical protein
VLDSRDCSGGLPNDVKQPDDGEKPDAYDQYLMGSHGVSYEAASMDRTSLRESTGLLERRV